MRVRTQGGAAVAVSVIIPVYNAEAYLRRCLESVTGQTLEEIEILCVDDGSTDGSLAILEEYEKRDRRLRILRRPHQGAAAARNAGLGAARGRYLSILDADDFFERDMLEKALARAREGGAQITVFQTDLYDDASGCFEACGYSILTDRLPGRDPFSPREIPERIFNIGCGWAWDKLFERAFVERCGIRFQNIRTTNDMLFVFYLYSRAERISVLREVLAHHRVNVAGTLSATRERSWDNCYLALRALQERLRRDGSYETYRRSFVNWSLNLLLWHMDTLQENCRRLLEIKCRTGYFQTLDILGKEPGYFHSREEYRRLCEIMERGRRVKVSVILCVYNGERYLRECLESIGSQTLEEIQILCVDDGSRDSTAAILEEFAGRDRRAVVIAKEHTNAGDGRNLGLELADGEYLSILDGDDLFEPDMLRSAYEAAAGLPAPGEKADVCLFRRVQFEDGEEGVRDCPWTLKTEQMPQGRPFSPRDCPDRAFTMTGCTAWDKLFRREFIQREGIRFQSLSSCNDMRFTFSALAAAARITTLDQVLVRQRVGHVRFLARDIEFLWLDFFHALKGLKDWLTERGLYETFQRGYLNWALDFSLWNMHHYRESFRELIRQSLKRRIFRELGLAQAPPETFFSREQYEEMREILEEGAGEKGTSGGWGPLRPRVSVVIPVYNVEPYLRLCLESAVNQTLEEIEIIAVNDGSTDGCPKILREYASRDRRIRVIDQPNGGYGRAMNRGIEQARGEYIGILEPDDFADPHMFEDLYLAAKKKRLDFVKADFYRFQHDPSGQLRLSCIRTAKEDRNYRRVIRPMKKPDSFHYVMNTWCGIYRRDFLEKHRIRHNETPGASFQDNGFWFQTMMYARRAMYLDRPCYFNRRDNPGSSVLSPEKVFCMNEEYEFIRELVMERGRDKKLLLRLMHVKQFRNYRYRYETIAPQYREAFLKRAREEFGEAQAMGELDLSLFQPEEREVLGRMMNAEISEEA